MSNRRMFTLAMGLVLSAAPLLWLDLDPAAGEKLLRWTSKQPTYSAQLR
ncbi:MAG: hypothetical protein JNN20_13810 [Betaproteobacteria bacterium]|nr:hypothetical protein [Betaproteobacteria bacterium]